MCWVYNKGIEYPAPLFSYSYMWYFLVDHFRLLLLLWGGKLQLFCSRGTLFFAFGPQFFHLILWGVGQRASISISNPHLPPWLFLLSELWAASNIAGAYEVLWNMHGLCNFLFKMPLNFLNSIERSCCAAHCLKTERSMHSATGVLGK